MDLETITTSAANGHATTEPPPIPKLPLAGIEAQVALAKELIAKRDAIDEQLAALFGGQAPQAKERRCGKCGATSHNARSCTAVL